MVMRLPDHLLVFLLDLLQVDHRVVSATRLDDWLVSVSQLGFAQVLNLRKRFIFHLKV